MTNHCKRLRFGDFTLTVATGELTRAGVPIVLQRKSFQVLEALTARPGQLVTREELRATLWPGDVIVEFDNNMNAAVNRLRRVLGDAADAPRFIETLPGRGYRFLVDVEVLAAEVGCEPDAARAQARQRSWPLAAAAVVAAISILTAAAAVMSRAPRPPQVAVLTFENVSGDGAQDHVGRAITEQLRARLGATDGQIGVVIPSDENGNPPPRTGRADYILSGSANNAVDGLHVTALLIDAKTNQRVWGAAYSCPRRDLAAIELQLATKISGLLDDTLAGGLRP